MTWSWIMFDMYIKSFMYMLLHITCHAHNVVRTYYSTCSNFQPPVSTRSSTQWASQPVDTLGDLVIFRLGRWQIRWGFRSVNGGGFKKSKPSKWWRYTQPAGGSKFLSEFLFLEGWGPNKNMQTSTKRRMEHFQGLPRPVWNQACAKISMQRIDTSGLKKNRPQWSVVTIIGSITLPIGQVWCPEAPKFDHIWPQPNSNMWSSHTDVWCVNHVQSQLFVD